MQTTTHLLVLVLVVRSAHQAPQSRLFELVNGRSVTKLNLATPTWAASPSITPHLSILPVSVALKLQMDTCVRCLRDGGADGAASVVLLLDEVEDCAGGDAVLEQVNLLIKYTIH